MFRFLVLLLFPNQDASASGEGNNNDAGAITGEPSQDTMGLEEETIPLVDYQNATIGAEMTGAIPSFLCTNEDNYIKIEINKYF